MPYRVSVSICQNFPYKLGYPKNTDSEILIIDKSSLYKAILSYDNPDTRHLAKNLNVWKCLTNLSDNPNTIIYCRWHSAAFSFKLCSKKNEMNLNTVFILLGHGSSAPQERLDSFFNPIIAAHTLVRNAPLSREYQKGLRATERFADSVLDGGDRTLSTPDELVSMIRNLTSFSNANSERGACQTRYPEIDGKCNHPMDGGKAEFKIACSMSMQN